jgi:4-hydroxybenzoate polyprenyltransferase
MLLAHQFGFSQITTIILGFFAFSFISSSVYLLNDLNDLESDRQHPIKRNRPIASGAIHLPNVFYLAIFLFGAGLALGAFLNSSIFLYILISYFILNFIYSKYLKSQPIIDIVLLSSFYTLRLVAGGILAGVEQSDWMITYAIFIFLSFAILKRYAEIKLLQAKGIVKEVIRGYRITDEPLLLFSGLSLSFISTLVFILYTQSEKVKLLYTHPKYLIFITPVLLLITMRIWFNTSRVTETDNPFELLLKDKLNFLFLLIIAVIAFLSV